MLISKFTKFLSFLEQQIGFSSNFASLFIRHNSMKVQICEIENLKFVTLMRSFCQNNVKFQLEKYRRVISWNWRLMQSLKTNWHKVSNMTRNFLNFHPNTQKSENFSSIGYFCPKYKRFELKETQRSYLSWHWTIFNIPWFCRFKNGMRNWVNFY